MAARPGRVYFDEGDADLRRRLRDGMGAQASHVRMRRLACELGAELDLAQRIAGMGFAGEAAQVFDLVPLIHVAWADGAIQRGERAAILEVLEARGLRPGDHPFVVIEALLEERPSEEFLEESLLACRDLLQGRAASGATVVELCLRVAEAAGGFLGLGSRISVEERQLIERVAQLLGEGARETVRRRFGRPD
jgi:tellurite resistance protein